MGPTATPVLELDTLLVSHGDVPAGVVGQGCQHLHLSCLHVGDEHLGHVRSPLRLTMASLYDTLTRDVVLGYEHLRSGLKNPGRSAFMYGWFVVLKGLSSATSFTAASLVSGERWALSSSGYSNGLDGLDGRM